MRSPRSIPVQGPSEGIFFVRVKYQNRWIDITTIRGVPTRVMSMSSADPFGPSSAEFELPAVTSFDKFGTFDLKWLRPYAEIDIVWSANPDFRWEGYIVSIEASDRVSIQCKGALYILDNYLAKPLYPTNPIPYETLIKLACTAPYGGLNPLKVTFPTDWSVTVPQESTPSYLWMLRPWGISVGEPWTGLTTRSTGSWEPYLTGFIQTLLGTMYTPEGDQWTLDLLPGRTPHLKVRDRLPAVVDYAVINGVPGVKVSLSQDWGQAANVIYGAGNDLVGLSFSNMRVSNDGQTTTYDPFAFAKEVHPNNPSNPHWDKSIGRKEMHLNFSQGIDEIAAREVAFSHLQRNADPGWVGSITLEIDPLGENNIPSSRYLMKAGQTIAVRHWCGSTVVLHINTVTVSPEDGTTSLGVDSRFRDALTAQETYARTRDALNPLKLLKPGSLSVTVNDLVKPWSYQDGSGIIPSRAREMFNHPASDPFPWLDLTTKFPPKSYPQYYVSIKPDASIGADSCWQRTNSEDPAVSPVVVVNGEEGFHPSWSQGVVIKMAQSGRIRLSQIAAYDKDGNVLPVEFHFAVYDNTVNHTNMPMPTADVTLRRKAGATTDHYPFFAGAFDRIKPTGEMKDEAVSQLPAGVNMVTGWGTYAEPAGYSPGLYSRGGARTGMLVDETSWDFDTTSGTGFDPSSTANTANSPEAGCLYGMIYCDETLESEEEIFFLGRFWVQPQGA